MFVDILLDTALDALKLLPFLFVTYLLLEFLEERLEKRSVTAIHKAGRWGPVLGSLLGVVPQCGFSAAASNLYAGGVVSFGTLLAVFLSTSDEMLPILISARTDTLLILKILLVKALAGMLAGFAADTFLRRRGFARSRTIHDMCEDEGCRCEDGVFKSALRHTLKIFIFLILVMLVLNTALALLGEERLAAFILNRPVAGELLAGLIGLIPNCAASVVITQLYLEGGMSAGAMLAGLLTGSGVGLLVLFRMNRNIKENLRMLCAVYSSGVILGFLAGLLPIF